MTRIFLPLICAALGFAAASCTQSDGPLAPAAEAPASARTSSQDATAAAMATPPDAPQASPSDEASTPLGSQASPAQPADTNLNADAPTGTALQRRASTLIGMPVVSADGSSLGAVKDIIFDRQGRATHLVISYTTEADAAPAEIPAAGQSAAGDRLTAMPWDAAMASIKNGRLVLDDAKLQGAPSFTRDAWPNLDDPAWSATTDAYWRKAVRAAIEAHPGAPIDSTLRQRGRPRRGGG
jgi:sporulation protein YlmC with PRC-barrel domain